jgi:predicted ATP-dependent endonuclease of OLD family
MSKANGTLEKKDTYLQHVSLKNYKSIKDAEIDFKPGLNIIIGKNASGKTNFINGLNAVLSFKYDDLVDAESKVKLLFGQSTIEIQETNKVAKDFFEQSLNDLPINHDIALKINGEVQKNASTVNGLTFTLSQRRYFFYQNLIRYGILYNEKALFINVPYSFLLVNQGDVSSELTMINRNGSKSEFITVFFNRLYRDIYRLYHVEKNHNISDKTLKYKIIEFSERNLEIANDFMANYSPIKSVRVNPDFILISQEKGQKISIANFFLEFSLDEKTWLTFNLLSDGTKRLFYIISELISNSGQTNEDTLNITLLEEPELGIHPHQLHLLMQFIKEQSKEKQVIITTHSPQVLDVIEEDELDHVVICNYDSESGTTLKHLNVKEKSKAKKYMEDALLSDYWRFSDLESFAI